MASMMNVAREANVAVSTVSLTLNHRERVKPETRKRIEQAIRRLGYRPRSKSKEGAQKTSPMRVAFIYTLESLNPAGDLSMSSYCREVISGMQESMAGSSSSLSTFRGVDHVEHDVMVNEQLNAGEFDGVILFGANSRDGYLDRLQQSGLPLVVINRPPEHGRFSCVTLDYYGGAQLAIEHLISLGHRRIALTMNDDSDKWLIQELCAGARNTFAAHGLEAAVMGMGCLENGSDAQLENFCRQAMEQNATAIFTGDHLVSPCAELLSRFGKRVPEDVSIIGFDDRGLVTSAGLTLTTIGYDKRRMGRMAIRMLQQLSQSRRKIRWLAGAVSTHVVRGQTTAEVPSAEGAGEAPDRASAPGSSIPGAI